MMKRFEQPVDWLDAVKFANSMDTVRVRRALMDELGSLAAAKVTNIDTIVIELSTMSLELVHIRDAPKVSNSVSIVHLHQLTFEHFCRPIVRRDSNCQLVPDA